ncbi:MAG: NAD(P)/FAD-dependent oxidoreductase [Novosphingobium sp.]
MGCEPTKTPDAKDVDIPALREKYRHERERRLRKDGQAQYVRPTDDVAGGHVADYTADPLKPTIERDPINEDLDVLVLGAGFGGLLASVHLVKAGITNFRNVDTAGDFGGVWYWNRYPGIQCDNDAYCYLPLLEETGFMPSQKFSDGAEIQGYCRQIAERSGFADNALFHTHVTSLVWDDDARRWLVTTNRGDAIRARFVIMAAGVLNMPKLPAVPGIEKFKGKIFHSARWDYEYTGGTWDNPVLDKLADKRVAILGTGATAIQIVPHLGQYAQHLHVIQRTPSTVDERPNPKTDPEWMASLKPGWQAERRANFHRAAMEMFAPGEPDLICDIWTEISRNLAAEFAADGYPQSPEEFMAAREVMDYRVMERLRQRVEQLVDDPATAEALKPFYRHLCKRPLSSNTFYPTFNQPNVTLVDVSQAKGLEAMTEAGFIADGVEYPIDCMIFASGFEVTSSLERRWGIETVAGRDGVSIYDHWRHGPRTLHGTMTNQFPNQFYIGYIQGGLNASVTEQFGRQGEDIAHIIAETLKRGKAVVEPTQAAVDGYVAKFREVEVDLSAFQAECTPGYFNNEGESKPDWALFRGWGPGGTSYRDMVNDWRAQGDLEGLALS